MNRPPQQRGGSSASQPPFLLIGLIHTIILPFSVDFWFFLTHGYLFPYTPPTKNRISSKENASLFQRAAIVARRGICRGCQKHSTHPAGDRRIAPPGPVAHRAVSETLHLLWQREQGIGVPCQRQVADTGTGWLLSPFDPWGHAGDGISPG